MSSNLQENLAAQQVALNANAAKRQRVIDAVLKIAQDQGGTETPTVPVVSSAASVARPAATPVSAGSGDPGGLNPDFNTKLQKLLNDYKGKVSISSGYRSPQRQSQLFAEAIKKYGSEAAARKWVAPPGHSEHNKGLAADLHFNDAATRNAIHQVAAKYGLVFPMAYENWHVEPIGARKK